MDIAKELESKLSKQMVPNEQKEEKEETPIVQTSVNLANEEPETNTITYNTKKKKKAPKIFEEN